ncbi:MAG: M28 family metallopeptidase [Clostridia bacterium]
MKRRIIGLLFAAILVPALFLSTSCSLQLKSKISRDDFVPDFSQERMLETIKILSAEDGGRIAGFAGEKAAAEYIAGRFREMGLEVSEQSFPIKSFTCNSVSVDVISEAGKKIEGAKALTYSAATPPGGIEAELISLGFGTAEEYKDKDAEGKIALMKRGGEYFYIKTARAYEMGAAAVVFYDPDGGEAVSATLTKLSAIPAVSISHANGEMLENSIKDGDKVEIRVVVDSITEDSTSSNVIGLYKAAKNTGGMRVIVGAHYDGVDTPAANDNASGIAAIIEMARALSDQRIPLPYDVMFIAFGAEEIGLVGSTTFVNRMRIDEKDSVLAMLNLDMVGVGNSFELYTVDEGSSIRFRDMAKETLNQMGYAPLILTTDRSDHAPFAFAGIQAVFIQAGPYDAYHTDFDTLSVIQPEVLVKICEFGTRLLVEKLPLWVE